MLKKEFKLPVQTFPKNSGKTIKGQLLLLKIVDNNKDFSRFNVIISSKYDKRAVYRNRLKRAIFEAIQSNLESIASGRDILIIINPLPASQSDIPTITKELTKLILIIK